MMGGGSDRLPVAWMPQALAQATDSEDFQPTRSALSESTTTHDTDPLNATAHRKVAVGPLASPGQNSYSVTETRA